MSEPFLGLRDDTDSDSLLDLCSSHGSLVLAPTGMAQEWRKN